MSDNVSLSELVADEIRVHLTRRRISGRKLAAQLGVSQTWMSTRLSGSTPIDLNELERIAAILNVQVADLLPRAGEGRLITTGAGVRQTTAPKLTRTVQPGPTGHPKRTLPAPSTRRPARTGLVHAQ